MTALQRILRSLTLTDERPVRHLCGLRVEPEDERFAALPVRSEIALDRLVSEILSETRSWPIVGLTARWHEERPALAPGDVRAIVGPEVSIHLIAPPLTHALEARLPKGLHVYGGAARIWWPLRDLADLSPAAHPLILDKTGQYGPHALLELGRKFRSSRPPMRPSEGVIRPQGAAMPSDAPPVPASECADTGRGIEAGSPSTGA